MITKMENFILFFINTCTNFTFDENGFLIMNVGAEKISQRRGDIFREISQRTVQRKGIRSYDTTHDRCK